MNTFKLSTAASPYTMTKIGEEAEPFKITSLTATSYGLFTGVCNTNTRNNSRLYLDGVKVYDGSDETIGQGLELGKFVGFAGECGHLLAWDGKSVSPMFALHFATTMGIRCGTPYVLDSYDGKVHAMNCDTQKLGFMLPGGGIATQCIELNAHMYASTCDDEHGKCGVTGSDGTFIRIKDCLCLVQYGNAILATSGNKVLSWTGMGFTQAAILDCEKIMHMYANDKLWIAGSGPDVLWVYDGSTLQEVCRFPKDVPVGGSLFRTRVTDGYFGRSAGGNRAEVYKIEAV